MMTEQPVQNLATLQSQHTSLYLSRDNTAASGASLIDPISVSYQGLTIIFAREEGHAVDQLFYNVLSPQADSDSDENALTGWKRFLFPGYVLQPTDDEYDTPPAWLTDPEVRVAGMDLITVSRAAKTPTPENARFAVVANGAYLYCYRQTTAGRLMLNRLRLVEVPVPKPDKNSEETLPPPEHILEPAWETRFQRSEKKDIPLDDTDTLGSKNMDGNPFFEPTIDLPGVTDIQDGRFAITLTPTSDPDMMRWLIAVSSPDALVIHTMKEKSGIFDYSEQVPPFTVRPIVEGVEGGEFADGPAATLYYQQETTNAATTTKNTVRRAGRLMVCLPYTVSGHDLDAAMAVYDFGLDPNGLPALIPEETALGIADGSLNAGKKFVAAEEPSYSAPDSAIHIVGKLTTTAVILGQLKCKTTPTLLSSGDGLLHLYYHQGTKQSAGLFRAAQFDTQVTRKQVSVSWSTPSNEDTGHVSFYARRPGSTLNGFKLSVTAPGGTAKEVCNVEIDYGTASEIDGEEWVGVPRDLIEFTSVLNGKASSDLADPRVRNGNVPYFDYSGEVMQCRLKTGEEDSFSLAHTRPDVILDDVMVSAGTSPDTVKLSTQFTAGGEKVVMIWPDLPKLDKNFIKILGGDAAPSEYDYQPELTETAFVPVEVTDGTGPATIFLFAKSADVPTNARFSVTVATSGNPNECNFLGLKDDPNPEDIAKPWFELKNVSREQSAFINAIQKNPETKNVFFYISPPQTYGKITNQSIAGNNGLRQAASLFAAIELRPDRPAAPLAAQKSKAKILQSHTIQSLPVKKGARGMTAADVIIPKLPQGGESGVINVEAAVSLEIKTPRAGAWLTRERPIALEMNQSDSRDSAMEIKLDGPKRARLNSGRRFTFETWLNPETSTPSRIVSYRDPTLDASLAGVHAEYQLGLIGQRNLNFETYDGTGQNSYFRTSLNPDNENFLLDGDFTWEFWVKPAENPVAKNSYGLMMQTDDPTDATSPPIAIGLDSNRMPVILYRGPERAKKILKATGSVLPNNQWSHIAVTAHLKNAKWALTMLVNGEIVASDPAAEFYQTGQAGNLIIGGNVLDAGTFIGSLADLRYWTVWRSPFEIKNTMFVSLRDTTPGLVGYWPLSENLAVAKEAINQAAATKGYWNATKDMGTQSIGSPRDDYFASLVGSVGGAPILEVPAFLHVTNWNHVAMTFSAGGALNLNPAKTFEDGRLDYVNCGKEASLDASNALAVDAWFAVGSSISGAAQTIISKWGITEDDQSYIFGLTAKGQLFCKVYLDGPIESEREMTVISDAAYNDGLPHHAAVRFSTGSEIENVDGDDKTYTTWTLEVFVNGVSAGKTATNKGLGTDIPGVTIHKSSVDVLLGMVNNSPDPETSVPVVQQAYLRGILGRTRFWKTKPDIGQMFPETIKLPPSAPSPETVVSEWDFSKGIGVIAEDKIAGNDGKLSSSKLWHTMLSTSEIEFYANGHKVYQRSLYSDQAAPVSSQFILGGIKDGASATEGFQGVFDETRIWDEVRTERQLAGNRFRPIEASETHLKGYWPFGEDGKATLVDQTLGLNDGLLIGTPKPEFKTSDAPVATEGPWIKNAYGGVTTDFHVNVLGRIAASDYGSGQTNSSGGVSGSLQRVYGFSDSLGLSLRPGYTIGSLDVTYIGQVQTDPQLIGYIEGAPPVPSENLSLPYYKSDTGRFKYKSVSSIALSQSTKNSVTYVNSQGGQTQYSLKIDGGLHLKADSSVGIGFSQSVFSNVLKAGPQINFNWQSGQDQKNAAGMQWSETWSDQISLSGEWEAPQKAQKDYLSAYIGRRFVPANIGYALVESLTADLYSLRLPRTGAMVTSIIVPNTDYGPDRNTITFPIKASYQKAGTLDGKIGLANDPAYGSSANLERKSYFNPAEAYKIRSSIANERAQRLTQFDQTSNAIKNSGTNNAEPVPPETFTAADLDEAQKARMNRGIVNTYVWTASGGLHAEQQEFGSVIESVSSGFSNSAYNGGLIVKGEAAIVAIGGYGNLDFLGGTTIKKLSSASGTDSRNVSLAAKIDCESYLKTWNQDLKDGDGAYDEGQAPGKVDSYRFMSAYLSPSADNSEKLVNEIMDDDWLRFSSDPNAVALRKSNIASNPAWRILHRVTYVSRVPPPQVANPSESVANSEVKPPENISGNIEMANMLLAILGDTPSRVEIGQAITTILIPKGEHPSPMGEAIPWWDKFVKAALLGTEPDKAQLLEQIRLDNLEYWVAAFKTAEFRKST